MHLPDEFMKRAAECERMAKFTRDPKSKTTWRHLAQRWTRCAKLATHLTSSEANRHRH
jgi:hypothetical protein